ncbi:MAG: methyltransferase domain-containing protein [Candidatus Nanopelagicales bacterium]|nr:methyltransferase domain-containing protein [Candidatus Nanopelagicales bacterium]
MASFDWSAYVADFHRDHPGITEAALRHARHPVHGTAYEWLASAVPDPAGDVLDLASGSCPMQEHLNARGYIAVDASPAEAAAATASGRGPVRVGDVTDLELPDACVDTVVMSMALMLVPVRRTLAQVARVLRPGGTFAAMVPTWWPLHARDLPSIAVLSLALRGPGSMPQQLSGRRLSAELGRAGLTVVSVARERFPFAVSTREDAQLAVASLYTPGRSPAQLRRAETWLARLPGRVELPVPLMRIAGTRPTSA